MADYKALRVKILLKDEGGALYPDFDQLDAVPAGIKWQYWVDQNGSGWLYDKVSGHKEEDAQSPRGQQWGVLLVPAAFADQAVIAFPTVCDILTEAQLEDFYDNRATVHMEDDNVNEGTVNGLMAQMNLLNDLDAAGQLTGPLIARRARLRTRIARALDPDDAEPGVQRNPRKTWQRFKALIGANIV